MCVREGSLLTGTAQCYATPTPSQVQWGVHVSPLESCCLLVIVAQNHVKVTTLECTLTY